MRRSKVLAKIRNGQVARICNIGHYLPYAPMQAALAKYDGVWIDGEHRAWDHRETQAMIAFHHLADIDCLWRPPTLEKTGLYRLLEDGAAGVIIPHVSTPEKAAAIVEATRFPPIGDRGFDGVGLDCGLTFQPFESTADSNRETSVSVQLETPQALDNAEAIAAIEGVDVLFLGPGDLSLRLGCSPAAGDPVMVEAQKRVAAAASKHGKVWGRPVGSKEDFEVILELGAKFVIMGGEFVWIMNGMTATSAIFDEVLGDG
jgi:4-hydroxy-2-oxoheptanedioate aldolase